MICTVTYAQTFKNIHFEVIINTETSLWVPQI